MLAGAERRLEVCDRVGELDLAARGEGKTTEEVEEPVGGRVGAGHELLASDCKCDVGDGDFAASITRAAVSSPELDRAFESAD